MAANVLRGKTIAAAISVGSNTTLVLLKLIVGLLMGSVSVISEAIHSGVDLIAAVIALFSVRASGKPSDREHPFGHGKWENISGTVEAGLIFLAAGWIIYEAVKKLIHPTEIESVGWGVGIMLASSVANWLVSRMLFKVGKATESLALEADAWHLRTDVYTSAGVMAGLAIIQLGRWIIPEVELRWVDPIAAIGVALLILHAAYELTVKSARDLLDERLPEAEEAWIRERVANFGPSVRGFHKLRTRKAGPKRFIEFHFYVDGQMPVEESHRLSHEIANDIQEHFADASVVTHVEPCSGICGPECTRECAPQRQSVPVSH